MIQQRSVVPLAAFTTEEQRDRWICDDVEGMRGFVEEYREDEAAHDNRLLFDDRLYTRERIALDIPTAIRWLNVCGGNLTLNESLEDETAIHDTYFDGVYWFDYFGIVLDS